MDRPKSLPLAISHRGLRTNAPENTVAAFVAALDAGADGIELDVHSTGDGVLIVHHDPSFAIDGTTAAFASSDSSTVSKARLDGDHSIPTLDQALEAIGKRARVFIEVKARGIESDVVRCLKRHSTSDDNYAVHSFDHRIVRKMLELMPSIRTGILQVAYPVDSRTSMRAAGARDLWQHVDFIDSRLVADVHSYGGSLIAWTANSPAQWTAFRELGVDGICTDRVDEYVEWRRETADSATGEQ